MDKYGFKAARVPDRHVPWDELRRPMPEWFSDAKLGIMIHWGAYSVPAWAEPTGELGTVDGNTWFRHNPYAEWYWNTIRFKDSPAREHHRQVYGDAAYDDFLDDWTADEFDPTSWAALFARAGARYVIPVAKHHDGITLWNAPGTGTRNTVARGPRRDLLHEIQTATRRAGMHFGVYYSGGLDWHVTDLPAHDMLPDHDIFTSVRDPRHRPVDAAYAAYAYVHFAGPDRPLPAQRAVERHRMARRRKALRVAGADGTVPVLLRGGTGRPGERPVGRRHSLRFPHQRVPGPPGEGAGRELGELPRDRDVVRLQPHRRRAASAQPGQVVHAPDGCGVTRRESSAERRAHSQRGHPAGAASPSLPDSATGWNTAPRRSTTPGRYRRSRPEFGRAMGTVDHHRQPRMGDRPVPRTAAAGRQHRPAGYGLRRDRRTGRPSL